MKRAATLPWNRKREAWVFLLPLWVKPGVRRCDWKEGYLGKKEWKSGRERWLMPVIPALWEA